MIIMYLFDSFVAGWFSNSFHKHLLNAYYVPGSAVHIPLRIDGLLPRNLFIHHQKDTNINTATEAPLLRKVQSSVLLLGNYYHAEVQIILKALLYVCKQGRSSYDYSWKWAFWERESSKAVAASLDLPQTHSQQGLRLTRCVLHFTVMFMPNNFFLTKWKKK